MNSWRPSVSRVSQGLQGDEPAVILRALQVGYLIRSGHRLAVLIEYRRHCHANRQPCVVVALGARQATIEVDGDKRWTGPVDDAEAQAAAIAAEVIAQPSLFCI